MSEAWPWLAVAALGAYHGINPAMGWLFAVARGLQDRSRKALLQALVPIAVGHLVAMAFAAAVVGLAQAAVGTGALRLAGGAGLMAFGCYTLMRPRLHSRWIGLQVRPREIAVWSALMSTAHGAGLMLVPVLVRLPAMAHVHAAAHGIPTTALGATAMSGGAGVAVHTLAMFIVMAAVALLVFERFGVGVLRRAWLNLDSIWAGVIVVSGLFTLVGS